LFSCLIESSSWGTTVAFPACNNISSAEIVICCCSPAARSLSEAVQLQFPFCVGDDTSERTPESEETLHKDRIQNYIPCVLVSGASACRALRASYGSERVNFCRFAFVFCSGPSS
jgi:hypothetical protein